VTVYARAHADQGEKIKKSGRRDGPEGPEPGNYVVDDPPLVIFRFPHDHELPVLARLFAVDGPRLLAKAAPGCRFEPSTWTMDRLRYKPGRRSVGRAMTAEGKRVLVKALPPEESPACVARARSFRDDGPLRVARLLGAYERRGIVAWEWIEGTPLTE